MKCNRSFAANKINKKRVKLYIYWKARCQIVYEYWKDKVCVTQEEVFNHFMSRKFNWFKSSLD